MFSRPILRTAARKSRNVTSSITQRLESTAALDLEQRLQFLNSPPYVLPGHTKITCPPMVYISGIILRRYGPRNLEYGELYFYVESRISTSDLKVRVTFRAAGRFFLARTKRATSVQVISSTSSIMNNIQGKR